MVFISCGLNHKTAPIALREKIAMPVAESERLLLSLTQLSTVNEAAILSTCNRTEIYCDSGNPEEIIEWLATVSNVPPNLITPHFYTHLGIIGIKHAIRVASGLDSMMLGEPQILGQMKDAYQQACKAGTLRGNLRPIFDYILRASKRVRTESEVGNNPISVAFAAVQLINNLFSDFKNLNVFIIGSGETSSLVAKYLSQKGVTKFTIANRSEENARILSKKFNGKSVGITDIGRHMPDADIIITATSCPVPFISEDMVYQALQQRQNKPMFLLDLSVPRDIEADADKFDNVHLYNIDDLQDIVENGMRERKDAAEFAEQLINQEIDNFDGWHRTLKANEIISQYRNQMKKIAKQELHRAQQKLSAGSTQEHVLTEFSERLINKLTHLPTVGIRQAAGDGRSDVLELVNYLFDNTTEASTT